MRTFERKSLAEEVLKSMYKNEGKPGVKIKGMRVRVIPFPPRKDKTNVCSVGNAVRTSQARYKGLCPIPVPKVRFPLDAAEESELCNPPPPLSVPRNSPIWQVSPPC